MRAPALLALEDGSCFRGESIGADGLLAGEVVFNTAITGYQEIISDPSYARQIVTLTAAHVGNVGTNALDDESGTVHAAGLVVRDAPLRFANWRAECDLESYLRQRSVIGLAGIDTRRLTRLLRTLGAQRGCIAAGAHCDRDAAVAAARAFPGLAGMDLAREVSVRESYTWKWGGLVLEPGAWRHEALDPAPDLHVLAYDFGVKRNILHMLGERGCRVDVVPAWTSSAEVLDARPDGVFLSNGPGDPEPCDYAIEAIGAVIDAGVPVFGICLGHQLLALASGARTVKMKFGHHGANHPVLDLATGKVSITSQNHGFAVDEGSLPECLRATHRSLFDGSLQGIERRDAPAFGFQGHPEASPGPHDVAVLFDRFVAMMRERRAAAPGG